jgi:hypothetical protein
MRPALLAAIAFVAGAMGGVASTVIVGEARAQAPQAVIVPVPAQGVSFRGAGGTTIARVRSEPAGGVIEVLDAQERVAVRLRATPNGGTIDLGAGKTQAPTLSITRVPEDPGY